MAEPDSQDLTTNQVDDKSNNNNPSGKGGFGDHPENRSSGGWDKTMVFSYQYRRFMNMNVEELKAYADQPESVRTVVEDLAYARVLAARKSLPDVREITDRTEGRAAQSLDITSQGEKIEPIVIYRPEKLPDDSNSQT